MPMEFREVRTTHKIHIFERGGENPPICGRKVGAVTYPITLEDVESDMVCKHCMKRSNA